MDDDEVVVEEGSDELDDVVIVEEDVVEDEDDVEENEDEVSESKTDESWNSEEDDVVVGTENAVVVGRIKDDVGGVNVLDEVVGGMNELNGVVDVDDVEEDNVSGKNVDG